MLRRCGDYVRNRPAVAGYCYRLSAFHCPQKFGQASLRLRSFDLTHNPSNRLFWPQDTTISSSLFTSTSVEASRLLLGYDLSSRRHTMRYEQLEPLNDVLSLGSVHTT